MLFSTDEDKADGQTTDYLGDCDWGHLDRGRGVASDLRRYLRAHGRHKALCAELLEVAMAVVFRLRYGST